MLGPREGAPLSGVRGQSGAEYGGGRLRGQRQPVDPVQLRSDEIGPGSWPDNRAS